jgi:hypothetical protein
MALLRFGIRLAFVRCAHRAWRGPRVRLGLVLAFSFVALCAHADPTGPHAKCFVREILATHEGKPGTIDPKITRLRPYFQKAPFTAWNSFHYIDEKDMAIAPATTDKFDLVNGKHASLTYIDHVLNPAGKHRLRLRLQIEGGDKKFLDTTFVLDEGGVVLQAGQKHENGVLVLGFSCDIPND